uniref:LAGLIDADG_2 domain-containing protein n=1 Tax=Strongyloides venezuelensis TaxID=75913 RepID=A0A0K0G5J1_STRVS
MANLYYLKLACLVNNFLEKQFTYLLQKKVLKNGISFSDSKVDFTILAKFIYYSSNKHVSIQFCRKELQINHNATIYWSRYIRKLFVDSLKQKETQSIAGLVTRLYRKTGESSLTTVHGRGLKTLLYIIRGIVEKETTIDSDNWRSAANTTLSIVFLSLHTGN